MEKSWTRYALVVVAAVWLPGISLRCSTALATSTASADIPSTTTAKRRTTVKPTAHKTSPRHRTYHAPYRPTYRPHAVADAWRFSSYGDPSLGDNPAGDDPVIRQSAVEALGNLSGSIVVVNPNSGRILSIVNQKLALTSGFTPCSTFKPMVALAALREGIITPNTKLYVGERARVDVNDALARSNNMFFHKLGEMLGFQRVTHYAREFGLGERAGLDIPGESAGVYPSAPPKDGGVGHLAYCGTDTEETPLQMAAIISVIANGGTLYALQYPRTPQEIAAFQPVVRRHLTDLAAYIPEIRDGLAGSVLYGTGRSAFDPDLSIYGKTGTCSENGAHLGWFMSFAGELQPQYAVVVLLRGGQMMYGPHAAEVAGHFYRDLLQKEHYTQAKREELPLGSPASAR